jgi:hypothetical protein
MTREEVAEALGLSVGCVRRTERRALKKCRRWCDDHGLELADLISTDDTDHTTTLRSEST